MTAGPRGRWSRNVLVTAQLSLAVMLLAVASLAVRTVFAMERIAPGYETTKLLLVRLELPASDYSSIDTVRTFYRAALERIGALPDVRAIAATSRRWTPSTGNLKPSLTPAARALRLPPPLP